MKQLFIFVLLLSSLNAFAQSDGVQKFDFRLGVGTSLLGSGDMVTVMFENQLNYKVSRYFATSASAVYGKSDNGVFETASFVQGNVNVYVSPLRNNRKNDFRVGTGLSYYTISDAYLESAEYTAGKLVDADYSFDKRSSFGVNVVLENTYSISKKFLVGLKLFNQQYKNGDINSGGLIKAGVKL